ncbi:entericidin A/B family lipoprotein [Arenibacterium sp. CAU 1754]
MIRLVLLFSLLMTLTACETAKGVGRDLESAGRGIQKVF